jgi:hypothetical protein
MCRSDTGESLGLGFYYGAEVIAAAGALLLRMGQ